MEYRKRHASHVWHWEPNCLYWPTHDFVSVDGQPKYARKCRRCAGSLPTTVETKGREAKQAASTNSDLPGKVTGYALGQAVWEAVKWLFSSLF